jgi:hypothetical protein
VAAVGLEPTTYGLSVLLLRLITKKINNLARQNPAKRGGIRAPRATTFRHAHAMAFVQGVQVPASRM